MTTSTLSNTQLTLGTTSLTETVLKYLQQMSTYDVISEIADVVHPVTGDQGNKGIPGPRGQTGADGSTAASRVDYYGNLQFDSGRDTDQTIKFKQYDGSEYFKIWKQNNTWKYDFNINHANGILLASYFEETSDDRLKHNETTINNALDIVMKLKAKRYLKSGHMYDASYTLMKDNFGNYTNLNENDVVIDEIGFIAQEVLKIEELSFTVDCEEEKLYSLNYNPIFVVGIQAIQELKISLDTKKEKVKALESKIVSQETLINSLLERVTALENK